MELAQYTMIELLRLQKGAEIHKEKQERTAQRGNAPSADQQRREEEALENFA